MADRQPSSKADENRDLSTSEKARLAGAIWIHGSIDIECERRRGYYYPRIMLSMPNPLPYDYKKDTCGKVWPGDNGYFTLEIGKQDLVEKRLREIEPFMGGIEKKQIELALQIIETKRLKELSQIEKNQRLKELYERWKENRMKLEKWINDFKVKYQNVEKRRVPFRIWNRAYNLKDC